MGRMSFVVQRHASADDFLAAAGDFLGAREAEHNLLFGIASWVRTNPELLTDGPASFATVTDAGAVAVSYPQFAQDLARLRQ